MQRLAPAGLAVLAGVSMYVGAAIAVGLFDRLPPATVAWFRISAGALILLVLVRPSVQAFKNRDAVIYGLATMLMNMTFYVAIAHLALGTAVAIEFIGPIAVAAWGSRNVRDWLSLILAAGGVVVISGASWSTNALGLIFALLAGLMWAAYIVFGHRIAGNAGGSWDSMTAGFCWAAVLGLPFIVWAWPSGVAVDAHLLALALGLGLFSSVVPYGLDQIVLRMAGAPYFAVLQAILPVTAAVVGAIMLSQWLSIAEAIGIALVVLAVALRRPVTG